MRRDFQTMYSILIFMLENDEKNQATALALDRVPAEIGNKVEYFAMLMEQGGLIRKIAPQPDFDGIEGYRMTWKGHCFLDLFDTWTKSQKSNNPLERLTADLMIQSF